MAFSDARHDKFGAADHYGGTTSAGGTKTAGGTKATPAKKIGGPKPASQVAKAKPTSSTVSSAAADHLVATGGVRTPSIPKAGVAQGNLASQDDALTNYAKAVGQWATRSPGWDVLAALAGPLVDKNEPMAGNPRSFAGGTWHTSTNPAGVAAMAIPGAPGVVAGPVLGGLYDAAGLPSVWHGGNVQPDMRNGIFGNTDADLGKTFSEMGGTGGGWFSHGGFGGLGLGEGTGINGGLNTGSLGKSSGSADIGIGAFVNPTSGHVAMPNPLNPNPTVPATNPLGPSVTGQPQLDFSALLAQIMAQGGKPPGFGQMVMG